MRGRGGESTRPSAASVSLSVSYAAREPGTCLIFSIHDRSESRVVCLWDEERLALDVDSGTARGCNETYERWGLEDWNVRLGCGAK